MGSIAKSRLAPFALAAIAAAIATLVSDSFALAILPLLLLLSHLVLGRLPGERLFVHAWSRRPRVPPLRWRAPRPRAARTFGPRGGALIAAGLCGRAPPLVPR